MITCPACTKQNQDHYRYCLGCGAELPRGGANARGESERPPRIADEATNVGRPEAAAVAPPVAAAQPAAAAGPPGTCPECGHVNPPNNRFCATCGQRLDQPAAGAPKKAVAADAVAAVLIALDPEGNEVGRHELAAGVSVVGRSTGGVFGGDAFLSPEHATFKSDHGRVSVQDADSLNGVFRKLLADQSEPLVPGQHFRIGQELLKFDALDESGPDAAAVESQGSSSDGIVGTIALVVGRATTRPSYPVFERGLNLGRERGDVTFPEDGYVSGLHCHVGYEDGGVFVTDLGSSNGTFVQLLGEVEVRTGDVLLMGQQLFRVAL